MLQLKTVVLMMPGASLAGIGLGPEGAGAAGLLLWLTLFFACGLLLFWGLPVATAALIAHARREPAAGALLWAGSLGWIGVLAYLHRQAAKLCPHCRTRIVAEATLCYWCGGDTQPAPLPEQAGD